MENIVQIKNLSFTYPGNGVQPLDDIELNIPQGSIFGLVGKNGAGKTTLFQILLGILKPDSGSILIAGHTHSALPRHKLGFVPERPYYHQYFRLSEYLTYLNKISAFPIKPAEVDELIDFVHLGDFRQEYLKNFSKGMLQRVGLAQALLNRPDLLILDEPMSGLDVVGQEMMRDVILRIHRQGTTVITSSHNLYEIERICTDIGILHRGKLKQVEMEYLAGSQEYALTTTLTAAELAQECSELCIRETGVQLRDEQLIFTAADHELYYRILQYLTDHRIQLLRLELVKPSLEKFILNYLREGSERDE